MTGLSPYLSLPGTAREALTFYADVFGGTVRMHTLAQMGRADGPADAIGHGELINGAVTIFASDAGGDDSPLKTEGLMFALLGTSTSADLLRWFDGLAVGGRIADPLIRRPWGAWDGQVVDQFGVHWLIGFETED